MKYKQHTRAVAIIASLFLITQVVFVMPAFAGDDRLVIIREKALEKLDESFQQLALIEQEKIDLLPMYLPEQIASFIQAVVAIAKEGLSTEEKLESVVAYSEQLNLMSVYQTEDCLTFAVIWVVAYVIMLIFLGSGAPFLMPLIMPLMMISMWGMMLCLF